MIIIPYLYIAIILIVIWSSYRVICLKKIKKKNFKREFIINIFFLYFLILINLTICKMSMLQIDLDNNFYINYVPLIETIRMFNNNFMGIGNALYNVIGNILLFIPFGFLIPLLFNKKNKFFIITLYGFLTSVLIEIIQLFTSFNTTDIDDIIFNTLGAVIGYFIFNIFYYLVKKTKLGQLVRAITSSFNGNLWLLAFKPVSFMLAIILVFTFINIYNSTISKSASNEEIAKVVFKNSVNTDFEIEKESWNHKIFLKDEGDYLNLIDIKKVLNDSRYTTDNTSIGQINKIFGDYSFGIINEDNKVGLVVFGKNKNSSKVEINFNGKEYVENLKEDQYFIITFPSLEILEENSDIYNIYNGQESKDLKIDFYDDNGNEYKDMKFAI